MTCVQGALTAFQDGAKPNGKGQGGQRNGFYVYTSHRAASHHATNFLEGNADYPLPVLVEVRPKNLDDWDIDCEHNAPAMLRLLGQHRHLFAGIIGQEFSYQNPESGTPQKFSVKRLNDGIGTFTCAYGNGMIGSLGFNREDDDLPSLQGVGVVQALCDHFCSIDPAFLAAKKQLLAEIAGKPGRAIKYIGANPLPVAGMQQFNGTEWKPVTLAPSGAVLDQMRIQQNC